MWGICGSAALLLLMAGCSQQEFQLGDVGGTVTYDGQPLVGASVVFQPEGEIGTISTDVTNSEGQYHLSFNRHEKGAIVGNHSVSIIVWPSDDQPTAARIKVPARYNTRTELFREVKPGSNRFDFELTSAAPKAKP
ncbi:carboxypeptidase regulatory-like domain-containing protein [Planctomicrobium sp. SH664]|uniref:carboxypeptidase regulatory-like domain-containing protein n=1 Tax=Planctomicrobium sp. SH664 TaxID=3448125 RepID=UPI003F5B6D7D